MRSAPRWTTAACAAASLLAAPAAGAQITFAGTANGCFGAACVPTAGAVYQGGVTAGGGLLRYDNATFGGVSTGGALAFGGTPVAGALNVNNFGSFTLGTLGAGAAALDGTVFHLLLTFSRPGGSLALTAPITGTLTARGSNVLVDFGGNGFAAGASATVDAGGGSFVVTLQDVALSPGATNDIKGMVSGFQGTLTGQVSAVPEPATVGLLAAGLTALAGVGAARRRARA